ncbi:MAG: type VII toxin-antitoxin system HepT family RNase toxin, partial [Microcoleaceae cyanobacterium]
IAERLFQLIVEIASDINGYLLVNIFQITPATYFESFINMSKQGIITQELANELAKSAGMRNRIVHQYDEIDQQVIFSAIPLAVSQYSLYIKQVNDFLKTLEVNNA